jgi:1-aminocyclopropane-1-carboxylate deaminase/D-cysteine desulfhydrase-like pyridoxal-dependent ACC family enzyme
VEPAPRLAAAVGLAADALWIKRDDLTGLGGGGNKLRKLRYTGAQALAAGATAVITTGAPQSNHARLTAAVAARLPRPHLHGSVDARADGCLEVIQDAQVAAAP